MSFLKVFYVAILNCGVQSVIMKILGTKVINLFNNSPLIRWNWTHHNSYSFVRYLWRFNCRSSTLENLSYLFYATRWEILMRERKMHGGTFLFLTLVYQYKENTMERDNETLHDKLRMSFVGNSETNGVNLLVLVS